MTAVWENNVYVVGIAKCCKENEINVYRKEIKMFTIWEECTQGGV
jgi:hypothetical protein